MRPPRAGDLRIGGIQPFTTLDFPGRHAAVVFTQGCPLRCVYCHNRDLIPASGDAPIAWAEVMDFLAARSGFLDAVVFSGGEPLVQRALEPAIRAVRALGFEVALHTSGILPDRFERILPLLDWVGLDIKAGWDGYGELTGCTSAGARARQSYQALIASGVPHEIRTTLWPGKVEQDAVRTIATALDPDASSHFVLQEARDPDSGEALPCAALHDAGLRAELGRQFSGFQVRRATG